MTKGHTTADGLFTLTEVECLGDCANAPMVQINDDNYEDLTFEQHRPRSSTRWPRGETPKTGTQTGRQTSCPAGRADDAQGDGLGEPRLSGGMG